MVRAVAKWVPFKLSGQTAYFKLQEDSERALTRRHVWPVGPFPSLISSNSLSPTLSLHPGSPFRSLQRTSDFLHFLHVLFFVNRSLPPVPQFTSRPRKTVPNSLLYRKHLFLHRPMSTVFLMPSTLTH